MDLKLLALVLVSFASRSNGMFPHVSREDMLEQLAQFQSELEEPGLLNENCPQCTYYEVQIAFFASNGFVMESPVCGLDGNTYGNECEAIVCGDTIAICAGECPCTKFEDPMTDWCPDITHPQKDLSCNPYERLPNVSWPEDCCELCDADPRCVAYAWAGAMVIPFSSALYKAPMCFLCRQTGSLHPLSFVFSGFKTDAPPPLTGIDYFIGDRLDVYWKDMLTGAGLTADRFGFNTTSAEWYCDDRPTCIGFGAFDDTSCDPSSVVCAGEDRYGHGIQQMAALLEMVSMGDARHYMCPTCTEIVQGITRRCNGTESLVFPDTGAVPPGLDIPGVMSQIEPSMWIECDCTMHYQGLPLIPNSYWYHQVMYSGIDESRVTYFGVQLYYDEMPTCVAFGAAGDACDDSKFVCAGGTTYGPASGQMTALAAAIANAPTHKHLACP